mmetsp:Transcript_12309/g.49373  ORF Transcript_12309/g.49373 Transcript_12309/m.49373 type:complete len:247 (-) Transcript_12309:134-874(-)
MSLSQSHPHGCHKRPHLAQSGSHTCTTTGSAPSIAGGGGAVVTVIPSRKSGAARPFSLAAAIIALTLASPPMSRRRCSTALWSSLRVPHPAQNRAPMMTGNLHVGHFLTFAPMINPPGSFGVALPWAAAAASPLPLPFLPEGAGAILLDFLEPKRPALMALSSLGTLPLGDAPSGFLAAASASLRRRLASFSAGVLFRRFLSLRFFLAPSPSTESSGVSARPRKPKSSSSRPSSPLLMSPRRAQRW